ncbi:hypothetical protein OsI_09060 [Oryza sativa Indica Group]|uniref:Uncharacterized protein n=1 Tax=Oryza sativa subsp. indica TaxID=39946 RepID=B8AJ42_ORYSI|nr:hypothetical protein OsI_09060 [Oryza sativa Indica Group]
MSSLESLSASISSMGILASSLMPPSMNNDMGSFPSFTFSYGFSLARYFSLSTQYRPSRYSTRGSSRSADTASSAAGVEEDGADTVDDCTGRVRTAGGRWRDAATCEDGGRKRCREAEEAMAGDGGGGGALLR